MSGTVLAADFGPLTTPVDVDEAVIGLLRYWLPTHLAIIERERNLDVGFLARPRHADYANTLDDDEFPDHKMPAILVTTAQTASSPDKDGNGVYYADWNVKVSCVVRGKRPSHTRWLASLYYGAVLRAMVANVDGVNGRDGEIVWAGGNLGPVADPTNAGRYLAAGIGFYIVYLDQIVQEGNGPRVPNDPYQDPDPSGDPNAPFDPLVDVTAVTTDVQGRGIGEPFDG